jgi:RNA-directed DNA polymerase
VQIPKPKGGIRQLGIPTVKDRVIQKAISQVLQPIFDPKFSLNSYGFRPKRNAHQALLESRKIVKTGKKIIVDLDLRKFFDEVNHQRLMSMLSTRIGDKRLLKLIFKIDNPTKHRGQFGATPKRTQNSSTRMATPTTQML